VVDEGLHVGVLHHHVLEGVAHVTCSISVDILHQESEEVRERTALVECIPRAVSETIGLENMRNPHRMPRVLSNDLSVV
jgi:hypothetical protein